VVTETNSRRLPTCFGNVRYIFNIMEILRDILFFVCVGLFTVAAALCDVRTRRIPNRLTVPVFVLGLVYQIVFNGWSGAESSSGIAEAGLKSALLAFSMGFGTLFVLWLIGGGGGGDVKLMGALSVWLGFQSTLLVMMASTVLVLVGTLAVMGWSLISKTPWKTTAKFIATSKPTKPGMQPVRETVEERQNRRIMAYGVPVALATWAVVLWKLPPL